MNERRWEIHAAYGGLTAGDIGRIMADHKLDPSTQSELLAASLATPFKELGRQHYRRLIENNGRRPYDMSQIAEGLKWVDRLGLAESPLDSLKVLPAWSFALDIDFILERPYLSRDDDAFYIIDNPVRKEKVFKTPMVSPSGWKGGIRSVATQGLLESYSEWLSNNHTEDEVQREDLLQKLWKERARRVRVFGNENVSESGFVNEWLAQKLFPAESDEENKKSLEKQANKLGEKFRKYLIEKGYISDRVDGRQGRLFCFPTFFDRIDVEVINPHDRERRVGKNPILLECVPAGASGVFQLLYTPYDFTGEGTSDTPTVTPDVETLKGQLREDLPLVAQTVSEVLCIYGFGAKTSSGFGTAETVAPRVRFGINDGSREGDDAIQKRECDSFDLSGLEESVVSLLANIGGGV